jgi:FixJ family two-component response regulator
MEPQEISLKIFIVDDEQELCSRALSVLEGYHIVLADIEEEISITIKCFASAASFLSVLPQEQPDILIIEDNLPDRSGMSVLAELNKERRRICTIITASDISTVEKALDTL